MRIIIIGWVLQEGPRLKNPSPTDWTLSWLTVDKYGDYYLDTACWEANMIIIPVNLQNPWSQMEWNAAIQSNLQEGRMERGWSLWRRLKAPQLSISAWEAADVDVNTLAISSIKGSLAALCLEKEQQLKALKLVPFYWRSWWFKMSVPFPNTIIYDGT